MGSVRKAHILLAYPLLNVVVGTLAYNLITGNYHHVFYNRSNWRRLSEDVKYLLFLRKNPPNQMTKYTALQRALWTVSMGWIVASLPIGFALYNSKRLGWLVKLMGGLQKLRWMAFLDALGIAAFAAGHIYLAFTSDFEKLKAMVTGYVNPSKTRSGYPESTPPKP